MKQSYPKGLWLSGFFGLVVSWLVLTPALAQGSTPFPPSDDEVNRIAKQMYCPVCENVPLDVCGTQACVQWRELIREKLSQGWTESQIKAYFVEQYGDRVLATPPVRSVFSLNWLAYVVPPLAFALGVFFYINALRKRKVSASDVVRGKTPTNENKPEQPIGEEYVARIEEEIRRQLS